MRRPFVRTTIPLILRSAAKRRVSKDEGAARIEELALSSAKE
jgi:hypothetical protein